MTEIIPNHPSVPFQPSHIVCLESNDTLVYTEVIQVVPQRQMCWVRPLVVLTKQNQVIDLRSNSDLLLPLALFRMCFDTEVIPLIAHLNPYEDINTNSTIKSFNLHHFIQQLWQTNQDKFKGNISEN